MDPAAGAPTAAAGAPTAAAGAPTAAAGAPTAAADRTDHRAVLRMMQDDAASTGLGIRLVDVGDGTATVTMAVTESMVNGHGIGHGGYVFLVADTAFACACNSWGPVAVAAHAEITFVRPVRLGDVLTARAVERQRWGRSGVCDVTVSSADGVVAEFRGLSRTVGGGA